MIDRRNFLQMTVGAAAAAHARPISAAASRGVLGANDRVRVGLIGCGSRGNQVSRDWMKHQDSVFVAACDVYKERLDETVERIAGVQGTSPEAYEDYRRILDRKDVDAVFIATPDHWHSPMTVDACAAGKDVYCREARLERDRTGAADDRGGPPPQPRRAGRAPAAQLASLPGSAATACRRLPGRADHALHDGAAGWLVPQAQRAPGAAAGSTDGPELGAVPGRRRSAGRSRQHA